MIDERERYEQAFRQFLMTEPAWEILVDRRDRKRRNQRIKAGVVGIAVFVTAIWIVASVGSFDRTQTPAVPGPTETGPAETGVENPEPPRLVEPMQIGTVTQSGGGCALELDAEPIPAGPGRLTIVNETDRWVSFELVRLDPEVLTFAQFEVIVGTDDYRHPRVETGWGWTSLIQREVGPRASGTITDNFTTGDAFAVVCLNHRRLAVEPLVVGSPYHYAPFAVVGPIEVR